MMETATEAINRPLFFALSQSLTTAVGRRCQNVGGQTVRRGKPRAAGFEGD